MSFEQEQEQSFVLQLPVLDLKLDLGDWMDGIGNETAGSESKVKYPEPEETERAVKRPCDYIMTPENIPRWLQDRSAYSYIPRLRPIGSISDWPAVRGIEQSVIALDYVAAFLSEMQTLIYESLKLDESCEMAREALSNRLIEIRENVWGSIAHVSSLGRDLDDLIRPKADSTHPSPLITRMFWEGFRRRLIEKGLNEETIRKKCMGDKPTSIEKVLEKVTGLNIEEMEAQFGRIPREFFVPYLL